MTTAAGTTMPPAAPARAARAFRIALVLLPLGVLGNVAYTLLATDAAVLATLGELPRGYLLAALALALMPWLTGTLRLMVWTRFLGHRIPARELLRMTLVVDLGAALSPTAIGGEAFRWGMLVRHGVKPGEAATLALLPKLEDAVFFFAIALPLAVAWTRAWELPVVAASARAAGGSATLVALGLALLVLATLVLSRLAVRGIAGSRLRRTGLRRIGRIRWRTRRTWREARRAATVVAARGKGRFAATLGLTTIHWIARYSVISALALFLGVPFDPVLFWLLQWVVFTLMSFIPTPGATGGAEVAFTAVYASLLPHGVIGLATAAWRLFTFYVPVALAAVLFAALARPAADRPGR